MNLSLLTSNIRNKIVYLCLLPFVFCLLPFAFSGCGKLVQNSDADFIGSWQGSDGIYCYTLTIDKKSHGQFASCHLTCYTGSQIDCNVNNGKARIKGSELFIGIKKISIDKFPTENKSNEMVCQLNGIIYTKL